MTVEKVQKLSHEFLSRPTIGDGVGRLGRRPQADRSVPNATMRELTRSSEVSLIALENTQ